jgi:hypothetical protein
MRVDSETHRQYGDPISPLLFFQNEESMLKIGSHLGDQGMKGRIIFKGVLKAWVCECVLDSTRSG